MPLLVRQAILQTLVYADIFDYPLTAKEIWRFLITSGEVNQEIVSQQVLRLIKLKKIGVDGDFYFLVGREGVVLLRRKRETWSQRKLEIAKRVAKLLKLIPTIKMVAVTGALAVKNAKKDDDIDLLIVTTKSRLWFTRMLTVLLVELMGCRRRPGDKNVRDKICLNMFLDEGHLKVPKREQDLFTAHEVCQLLPLWEKKGVYDKFIRGNRWVKKYLANGMKFKVQSSKFKVTIQNSKLFSFLILIFNFAFPRPELGTKVCILHFAFLERVFKKFQLWYMKSRRTTEKISEGAIRFHPQDCRKWILEKYRKRLGELRLPLDKSLTSLLK